ncbi:MAG TPA: DUF6662 family protein [Micropepsaceae bacterium]|nr:DUF6662 family protein [Micropepsaceae bacterium]
MKLVVEHFTMGMAVLGAAIIGAATPARADESPFASIYTAEILPQGGMEIEQWATWASSKPDEQFDEVAGRTEVEYGITNRFQLALYANYSWTKIVPKGPGAPDGPVDTTRFNGFSAEAIYQVLNPYTDPFGFALYLEPAIGPGERALEAKLLFQKNFLDDQLIFAANVNLEYVWGHDVAAGIWDHETALEFYLGVSYRFAPGWFGGVELLNENGYSGHFGFDAAHPKSNAFYFGPAFHYATETWWATLAVYEQLPWAGNPAHDPGAVSHGLLVGAERLRVRFRLGIPV